MHVIRNGDNGIGTRPSSLSCDDLTNEERKGIFDQRQTGQMNHNRKYQSHPSNRFLCFSIRKSMKNMEWTLMDREKRQGIMRRGKRRG